MKAIKPGTKQGMASLLVMLCIMLLNSGCAQLSAGHWQEATIDSSSAAQHRFLVRDHGGTELVLPFQQPIKLIGAMDVSDGGRVQGHFSLKARQTAQSMHELLAQSDAVLFLLLQKIERSQYAHFVWLKDGKLQPIWRMLVSRTPSESQGGLSTLGGITLQPDGQRALPRLRMVQTTLPIRSRPVAVTALPASLKKPLKAPKRQNPGRPGPPLAFEFRFDGQVYQYHKGH